MLVSVDALAQRVAAALCNPYGSRVESMRDLDSLVGRIHELEAKVLELEAEADTQEP